ncbi:MAG: cupin domain-containing protein [Chthoniobacteraceae bacterium]
MRDIFRFPSGVSSDECALDFPLAASPRAASISRMTILNIAVQVPFTTKDGSTIRSILDRANAPVKNQSLAEATVPAGCSTQRHFHRLSEEFYFILEGSGSMEIDGEQREVVHGDAVLIPSGAWHTITARATLRFLCCCAPSYSHDDTYFE